MYVIRGDKMKNKMLNFSGVSLSVSFDREKAEPIVENISKGCLNESNTPDPDELINSLVYMSECDKSHFIDKIDTSLTGDYIKQQEHLIDEEILEDYKELQNIMRLMLAYEALQSGEIDLIKSAMKKILYYFNSEFQRDNSDELLNEYLDKMTEDEMKQYLQDFLANNLETSTFFSAALLAKKEEESNKQRSYSGGYSGASSIPSVRAISNDEELPKVEDVKQTEIANQVENVKQEEVLKSDNKTKEVSDAAKKKDSENIKNDFLNSSSNKKQSSGGIQGAVEAIKNAIGSTSTKSLSNSVGDAAASGIDTVKDLIANGGKLKETIDGKLSSSITSIANRGMETIKPLVANVSENMGNSSAVIPGVAGLSTAAVAGLGTKVYMDKRNDKNKETTKFFDNIEEDEEEEKEEQEEETKPLSREDLLNMLDK